MPPAIRPATIEPRTEPPEPESEPDSRAGTPGGDCPPVSGSIGEVSSGRKPSGRKPSSTPGASVEGGPPPGAAPTPPVPPLFPFLPLPAPWLAGWDGGPAPPASAGNSGLGSGIGAT